MADDSNSWDNAIDEILNSSADDIRADPTPVAKPSNGGLLAEPIVMAQPAIGSARESPPTLPNNAGILAGSLPPSLFSRESLPLDLNDASTAPPPRPSLFENTNGLFGDSPKPTPASLFGPSAPEDKNGKSQYESDGGGGGDDDDDDVLDLLNSPSEPAKLPPFSSSTSSAPAPSHFSPPAVSPTATKPASPSPPKTPAAGANADDNDPPLPDFLSMISGASRGGGGVGSDGGDARARRRRLLNLAHGQFGSDIADPSALANDLVVSSKQTSVVDPLAALLGGPKASAPPAVHVPAPVAPLLPAPTPAVEQQIPRDPLAGLLKEPRRRASGGTVTTLGTPSDHPPMPSSKEDPLPVTSNANAQGPIAKSPTTLPFLQPKSNQPARPPSQTTAPALSQPLPASVPQTHPQPPSPSDPTHAALLGHIQSLESQLASLTAHNTTLQSDLTSLRTLLTSTQAQLTDTQNQLIQATNESASLLRSAHDQLTTAASAVTQRDQDAVAMHQAAQRELDARSAQVGEREEAVEREWEKLERERGECKAERERVAEMAEDAGKVLAKALAREAEVGEWVRDEMNRVKAEREAVSAMREVVESELSAQRAELMAMRERIEMARSEFAKQAEEERRILASERSEVAKVRAQVQEEQERAKKWKTDMEQGVSEFARAMELEASELARKAERVARDEAKVGVLMHKVHVAESRISVEREAVEDRAREVARLLEDARGVYARSVAERREAARMHREAGEWRRNGREDVEEEWEKVKREWEKVKEERKRVEMQVAELARRAVAQEPFAAMDAWAPHAQQYQSMAPPSPVSPGQSVIGGKGSGIRGELDAAILEDCKPKVQYIPRRFHPTPSDISFESMLSP